MTDLSGAPGGEVQSGPTVQAASVRFSLLLVFCFTCASFVSALLLFFVQPMFAKMALPLLGGSPGVWNTAMVFFQAVLLGGYLYAHFLCKHASFRNQILIHGIVLCAGLFFLPIMLPSGWTVPSQGAPALWLVGLFFVALGAPFFALAANAPLIQRWFSYTNHHSAHDPYFLYAASNAGSLLSLLSYPFLVEPFFRLSGQSAAWTIAYFTLANLVLASGFLGLSMRNANGGANNKTAEHKAAESKSAVGWTRRLAWTAYSLIPSSLMLGVTAHLTSNVASAPFIWVLPLALYLLTFVIAFSPRPLIPPRLVSGLFPVAAVCAIFAAAANSMPFEAELAVNLACFFLITQMCHNRLAATRPEPARLTEFYFIMSLGGVIGGGFTALAAPVLFNNSYEYPLAVALSALVAVGSLPNRRSAWKDAVLAVGVAFALWLLFFVSAYLPETWRGNLGLFSITVLLALAILCWKTPIRFFIALTAMVVLTINISSLVAKDGDRIVYTGRSFFGVSKVILVHTDAGKSHEFRHGDTRHNVQLRRDGAFMHPLGYYAPEGSFGQAIDAVRAERPNLDIAAIGLGAGALACLIEPEDNWRFYEIDPLVVDMARNRNLFTFVDDCAPMVPIEIGDARLTLENAPENSFDLIIIDAFSSNSVPAHLLTKEALSLYRSKLKPDGFVFFHTSNRNLDVSSVVLNVAESAGLGARKVMFRPDSTMKYPELIYPSQAVMVGAEESLARIFRHNPAWKKARGSELVGVWSDDFSHVVGALAARRLKSRATSD